MRRLIAIAGLSVAGGLFLTPTTASACDPNRPPYCMTVCSVSEDVYRTVWYQAYRQDILLPHWSELPVC
ncbi:MAG TPA: hypothetical protein VNA20_04420 [Frankiaceae bacterium]|nr:hypothetical protein [Frankiaceae bacterium]